jgi:hypothetical protein
MLHSLTAAYGTSPTSRNVRLESAKWGKADIDQIAVANCYFMSAHPKSRWKAPESPGFLGQKYF